MTVKVSVEHRLVTGTCTVRGQGSGEATPGGSIPLGAQLEPLLGMGARSTWAAVNKNTIDCGLNNKHLLLTVLETGVPDQGAGKLGVQ